MVENPLVDHLIAALTKLGHPELRFKDWVDEMKASPIPSQSRIVCLLLTSCCRVC
jgi:hypothetical protein